MALLERSIVVMLSASADSFASSNSASSGGPCVSAVPAQQRRSQCCAPTFQLDEASVTRLLPVETKRLCANRRHLSCVSLSIPVGTTQRRLLSRLRVCRLQSTDSVGICFRWSFSAPATVSCSVAKTFAVKSHATFRSQTTCSESERCKLRGRAYLQQ
eukprot:3087003-Rhodomonas_salina.2